jgi:tetratricopeptide (TPR) repeat protein
VSVKEKAFGPDHPQVASSLGNLAGVLTELGQYAQAQALHERALAIKQNALGPEHPSLAPTLSSLADVHFRSGAHEEARSLGERALTLWEQAHGRDHVDLTNPLIVLAGVALAQGRAADALALAQRAVDLTEAADAPPEDLGETRFLLAQALWAVDRDRPRARLVAEQALADYRSGEADTTQQLDEVQAWLRDHAVTK